MADLVLPEESYRIIGACFEVYNDKGCGFTEAVYQECLKIEFEYQRIPAISEPRLELVYRSRRLEKTFEPDFVCFGKVIVELKAVSKLVDEHRSQVINSLNATGFHLGLLVNFGSHPKLEHERLVLTRPK